MCRSLRMVCIIAKRMDKLEYITNNWKKNMRLEDILDDMLSLVTQLSLTLIIGYALNVSVGIDVHSKYAIIMYIFGVMSSFYIIRQLQDINKHEDDK